MAEKTKSKGKVLTTPERCKQCGLCVQNCPVGAISFGTEINSVGYNYTIIDHDKCTVCGICYLTCPDFVYEIQAD